MTEASIDDSDRAIAPARPSPIGPWTRWATISDHAWASQNDRDRDEQRQPDQLRRGVGPPLDGHEGRHEERAVDGRREVEARER